MNIVNKERKKSYKQPVINNYNRKKTKTIKKLRCSPLANNTITNSCYNSEMINNLVYNWNKKNKNNKINTKLNVNEKYRELYNKLNDTCSDERCWANKLIKTDLNRYLESFAPYSPSTWVNNPTEWLSNIEIIATLKQYEKSDKTFKFLGTTPIDFDDVIDNNCVTPVLCKFSLTKYIRKGINKIGIIFNTDKHNEPGSHWISLYINIQQKLIFFFDSSGNKCSPPVLNLVNRIIKQGKDINISFKFEQNYPMVHQKGHTECGMYCLFFLINMVKNTLPIDYFKTKRIPDEEMIKHRNIYFNN
jgi:hypothetical protein